MAKINSKCLSCSCAAKLWILGGFGLLLTLMGSVILGIWSSIYTSLMHNMLSLHPDSMSYPIWAEPGDLNVYMEFYFFNWTNPDQILNPFAKPNLVETGPYVFREYRRKVNQQWNSNNESITFLQNKTWSFEPSLSRGSLDDEIIQLNIPAVAAVHLFRNLPPFFKFALNVFLNLYKTNYFIKGRIGEFIFEGYREPILEFAYGFYPGVLPVFVPFDRFGWFYQRNGSADYEGVYTMQTGVDDISNLGRMTKWNYKNHSDYFPSYCGYINGSAGELFPPHATKSSISLFAPDICRSVRLSYKEEVKVEGVNGYRYWSDPNLLGNDTTNEDNWCFCGDNGKECYPNGVANITLCKWGVPAFLSLPHFHLADPIYADSLSGMSPIPELHYAFVDLEPETGIPLNVSAAFQVNILLQPVQEYELLKDMPRILIPSMWFRQVAYLTDDLYSKLKLFLLVPDFCNVGGYILISIGIVLFGFSGIKLIL